MACSNRPTPRSKAMIPDNPEFAVKIPHEVGVILGALCLLLSFDVFGMLTRIYG